MDKKRDELLLKMYDQMFNDIDRHILVVWQSVSVIIGAFAIFALVEKEIIPIDYASTLILILCGWLFAHLHDAGYWYNRNLVIIANIERQFLRKSDQTEIHYYFGKHRPNNKMISHLRIQYGLGVGIAGFVILLHFFTRVFPGFWNQKWDIEIIRALPYVATVGSMIWVFTKYKSRNNNYEEFLKNSPGKQIDTEGIEFGPGHGFKNLDKKLTEE